MKKLLKVKPLFNRVITTMDCYEDDVITNGVIERNKTKGSLKEYQTVIAVGDTVRSVKEGDIVAIDPTRYAVMKHSDKSLKNGIIGDNMTLGYKFNTININGKEHLMLYDSDITFIVLESTEEADNQVLLETDKPEILL